MSEAVHMCKWGSCVAWATRAAMEYGTHEDGSWFEQGWVVCEVHYRMLVDEAQTHGFEVSSTILNGYTPERGEAP